LYTFALLEMFMEPEFDGNMKRIIFQCTRKNVGQDLESQVSEDWRKKKRFSLSTYVPVRSSSINIILTSSEASVSVPEKPSCPAAVVGS
jgi:hypothetical protein